MPAEAFNVTTGPALLQRAAAIRLPLAQIARQTRLEKHTVGNLKRARDGVRMRTLAAVQRAVEAEELRLRDHLLALHPVEPEAADA